MAVLGIDFGIKNIGLAIATGPLAEPLTNLKVNSRIFEKLQQICLKLEVNKIVVGISEGKMALQTQKFTKKLKNKFKIPVVFQDETLTTKQAIRNLSQTKAKKKKRLGPNHAFAATLILQEYLDQKSEK
jgi:putative Holliday junction resolvase